MNSNIEIIDIFATKLFYRECSLDIDEIKNECYKHYEENIGITKSNYGGYQSESFFCTQLENEIVNSVPLRSDKPLNNISVDMWLNVNKKGDYNDLHCHGLGSNIALAGVFYVQVPENCGRLRLYDPRGSITSATDQLYYNNGNNHFAVNAKENLLIMFPSWLQHTVEPSNTDKDRISIAFNVKMDY